MSSGLDAANAALAAAFRAALLRQGTLAFLIFVLLAIAWVASRETVLARDRGRLISSRAARVVEPAARRVLRIGFGLLWIFDGLLQAQPAMPGGLPSHVIGPGAAGAPGWVQQLAGWAGSAWSHHPVQAAAAAVWIQLGLGIWLVSAPGGRWSRLAGLVGAGWALVIWVFGEAFGGLLAPGASWLLGAPGAALFYCAAGALIALPGRSWRDIRLGRRMLQATGLMLLGCAVFQAWPGRGFWPARGHGAAGTLASMVRSMAATRQPTMLAGLVSGFARFVAEHGAAVNLAAILVLTVAGACLLTGRLALARPAVVAMIAFCLVDWVVVQDLGFLGGLGTDPNSMIPQAILLATGVVAISRVPVVAPARATTPVPAPSPARATNAAPAPSPARATTSVPALSPAPATNAAPAPSSVRAGVTAPTLGPAPNDRAASRGRSLAANFGLALGTASTSAVMVLWAVALVLLGAGPMALAAAEHLH